jgi:hypothetical protein
VLGFSLSGWISAYLRYLEILYSERQILDHLLILTQSLRLSSVDLLLIRFLFSGPLKVNRVKLIILRLSLPLRLSMEDRLEIFIMRLLWLDCCGAG